MISAFIIKKIVHNNFVLRVSACTSGLPIPILFRIEPITITFILKSITCGSKGPSDQTKIKFFESRIKRSSDSSFQKRDL